MEALWLEEAVPALLVLAVEREPEDEEALEELPVRRRPEGWSGAVRDSSRSWHSVKGSSFT
jgi:hypothetical protein